MSTTVTGKLNKAANQFAAGESTGFGIRLGVQYYDRDTKQKEWTNYQAVIFAKAPGQVQFYKDVLIEGAVIEVIAEQAKIDVFQGNDGPRYSIDLLNARLGFTHTPQGQQAPRQEQYQNVSGGGRGAPAGGGQGHQQQRQAPPQNQQQGAYQQPSSNFDDDIPGF